MISTLDVHLASESKIDGESDWYRILSLTTWADEEEVKKQYRKLALQLHPDKNKSVGAEAAFKLISEAWSVLSDKSRKMLYDQKRREWIVWLRYEGQ
jgi:curved DNA-binding protein CbpA